MQGVESSSTSRYGRRQSDFTCSVSPSGYSRRLSFSSRYVDTMSFAHVRGFKAWKEHEQTPQESWEQFDGDVIAYGRLIRYYPDRSNLGIYQDFVCTSGQDLAAVPVEPTWRGPQSLWRVGPLDLLKRVGS
jgi:hypothetical protein